MRMLVSQANVGPIVSLGVTPSGEPADLASAAVLSSLPANANVVLSVGATLSLIPATAFENNVGAGVTSAELASAVSAEAATRAAADAALGSSISSLSAELSMLSAGVTSAQLATAVSAEASLRAAADAALAASISSLSGSFSSGDGGSSYLGPVLGVNAPLVRPSMAQMQALVCSGGQALTVSETNPGPIYTYGRDTGYNMQALCHATPPSGDFDYEMLVEALPGGSGPGMYIEDASGNGLIVYFYNATTWYGQFITNRNSYASTLSFYNNVPPPPTLWYRVQFDATLQTTTILISSNRIQYQQWGDIIAVSGGYLGRPVFFGAGSINRGVLGSAQSIWALSLVG